MLEPLWRRGMRVFAYLDNLLLAADSREQAVLQTQVLVSHLRALRFLINLKKELPGSKSADFISWFRNRFCTERSYAVGTKGRGFSQLSGSVSAGQAYPFSFGVETAGTHCLDVSGCPSGSPLHACILEMRAEHGVECRTAFKQTGDNYAGVHSGSDLSGTGTLCLALVGQHVLVRTDNTTVMSYINMQGVLALFPCCN